MVGTTNAMAVGTKMATIIDMSDATGTAQDVAKDVVVYTKNGQRLVGTAVIGGASADAKPAITYTGKWSGWHIEFYGGAAYWEAIFYTSGTLNIGGSYSADIWGVGGGAFDYSGVMGNGATATVSGVTLSTGQIAVTVGAGATKYARGNGGNTTVGASFTATGGVMNTTQTGPFCRFGDSDKADEAGEDGTSNGYAYGKGGWLHWRGGYDNGDGEGYGAGGDYGGYGNALVNAHPGVCVIRIAM